VALAFWALRYAVGHGRANEGNFKSGGMKYTREQAEVMFNEWMESEFIIFENFLNDKFPPIEVGKWYKSEREPSFLGLVKKIDGDMFYHNGFDVVGNWQINDWYGIEDVKPTPATEQEVLDRLTEEAKKRYKVGDRVKSVYDGKIYKVGILSNRLSYTREYFAFSQIPVLNLSTGEWAEVVESNPIHDKIEALERELAELKELINK
jgi:hypothetical protein